MSLAENELRNLYLGSSSTDDLEELETPDQFSDEIPVREHKKSAFRKVSVLAEEAEEDNEANAEDWEKTIQMRAREVSKMSVAEAGVLPVPGSPRVTIEQEEIVDDEPKVRFKSQVVLISHSDNEESILENPNKSRKELKKKDKKNKKTKKDEPKNVIKSPTNSKEFSSETRAKSILKRTVSPREKARIQLKHDEMQKAIAALRAGAVMTKFSQKGIPSKRYFKVSKDGTELKWKKPRGGFWTVCMTRFFALEISKCVNLIIVVVELAAVKLMIVGPRTQSFAGYDWKSKVPWNCFSLVADHRTVDIECHTQKDVC